jgi:hypothetical protein
VAVAGSNLAGVTLIKALPNWVVLFFVGLNQAGLNESSIRFTKTELLRYSDIKKLYKDLSFEYSQLK